MSNGDMPVSPVRGETNVPFHESDVDHMGSCMIGLTKREECAMRNLQGILANPEFHKKEDAQTMIDFAVEMADALLKELEG